MTINAAPPPTLSIADAAISEGNSGTKPLVFTVRLSYPSTTAVSYTVATANGTASAGSDYVSSALSGQTIPAGQTSRTFTVNIGATTGAPILGGQAVGTILGDDRAVMSTPLPSLVIGFTATPGNAQATASDEDGSDACGRRFHPWRIAELRACLAQMSKRPTRLWMLLRRNGRK